MQIHKFFILLFLYLAPFNLVAQSPYVQKFSHSAELPRVRINDIMQDHKGYIWLATSKGLYQFNGSEYRLYGKNSNLYHANIAALYLSEKDSSLWITAVDGRTWRKKDDNLIFQSINDGLNKAKGAPIKASIKETDSTLHFYTYELEEFCFANNSLIKKDTVNYLSIAFDLVKKLQPKWQQKIAIFLQLNLVDLYRDERFKQGNIILFSNKQKAIINFGNLNITADNKNIQASYNQDMILDMKAIDGVILKSIYGKGLIIEKPNKAPDTILSSHIITKIFVDQHDGIWIGTLTGESFLYSKHSCNNI